MHVKVGKLVVHRDTIFSIDCEGLTRPVPRVWVSLQGSLDGVVLEGQEALDLVMQIQPSALEGKRLRFARHAWTFHNLVAHPALQVLSWLGMTRLGFKIHDATVPRARAEHGRAESRDCEDGGAVEASRFSDN
jgi:hypothetical protein